MPFAEFPADFTEEPTLRIPTALLAAAACLGLAGCGDGPDISGAAPVAAPKIARDVLGKANAVHGAYPLDTCVVSGEKLGTMGEPFVFMHEGQEVRLCCPKCRKEFDSDPAKYLAKIEEAKKGK
jgi:YHS domain-containing protein